MILGLQQAHKGAALPEVTMVTTVLSATPRLGMSALLGLVPPPDDRSEYD